MKKKTTKKKEVKGNIELDDWQKKVLESEGNICLRSGRQVGKSTIISIKASEFAVHNSEKTIMVIASVERQSYLLFEKILNYLVDNYPRQVCEGMNRPTKHKILLKNGSVIYCYPTGLAGLGIRGYTLDLLIADEAAFIPNEVFTAVTPMLASTKGIIWLLSTPHGKGGYYYDSFKDANFSRFHISSEECERIDKEFLKREKLRMTKVEYAQEYLGEFVDELLQFFNSELIKKAMTLDYEHTFHNAKYEAYLGVDVARMGEDATVLISVEKLPNEKLRMIDMEITEKTLLTETTELILSKDKKYHYKKIYIDDGGLGVGVFDPLLKNPQTKRKVEAINNSQRDLNREKTRKTKLMKEVLYTNLLRILEGGNIGLFNIDEIFFSLRNIQYEYTPRGMKIFGKNSHIAEALVRAAYCIKDKNLNIWLR